MTTAHATPADHTTEAHVLGAVLLEPSAISQVRAAVGSDAFDFGPHRTVFDAMCRLDDRSEPIDTVSVGREIGPTAIGAIGGYAFLSQLTDRLPTTAHLATHLEALAHLAAAHKAQMRALRLAAEAGSRATHADLAASAEAIAEALAGSDDHAPRTISRGLEAAFDRVEGTAADDPTTPTGFKDLDRILAGGWRPGKMIVVGARKAVGKTALALCFARAATECGAVLFESLEMPESELVDRLLCAEASVDNQRYAERVLAEPEISRLASAADRLDRLPLFVSDREGLTLSRLKQHIKHSRREATKRGTTLRAVVVDYVALMTLEGRWRERHEGMADLSRKLKELAKAERVCLVALAQLHKAVDERKDKRPRDADLRESQQFANDADVVALIHRPAADEPHATEEEMSEAELLVTKNRGGRIGGIPLRYVPQFGRFHGLASEAA